MELIDLINFRRDRLQISLLILSELKRAKDLLLPLKSSENHRLFDDFSGSRSQLIRLILEAKFGDDPVRALLIKQQSHKQTDDAICCLFILTVIVLVVNSYLTWEVRI